MTTAAVTAHVEIRRGSYVDSVTLLQVSRDLATVTGVSAAQVAMATELNLDVLRGMGFEIPKDAGPNDMVLALKTDSEDALKAALAEVDALLHAAAAGSGTGLAGGEPEPRSLRTAAGRTEPSPTLALVSVPGPHAFAEAMSALRAGLSVMVFSDNVPVAQEVRLKDEAAQRGLLVMGPDCGTAVVGGAGLGFANAVRPGPVGLVAASGTGAQQLMCLLDGQGVGISACLGVGGRDLSGEIRGRSSRRALELLDADPATELIVVVSKPPEPSVGDEITSYAQSLATPVVLALLGGGRDDLTAVAQRTVEQLGRTWTALPAWPQDQAGSGGALRGLFAGGTLCDEAMLIAAETLGEVRSNIPLRPEWALGADLRADGTVMIDFGDDALTQGRAHPMIDQRSRVERIAVEAADPTCGVLLLDVVLGHGAHPNPASELAPALADARRAASAAGRDLPVVISLCATESDPQGLQRQAEELHAAGAAVYLSNAEAARAAVRLAGGAA